MLENENSNEPQKPQLNIGAVIGSFPFPVNVDGEYIDVSFKDGTYYIKQIKKCESTYHNTDINGTCMICRRTIRE